MGTILAWLRAREVATIAWLRARGTVAVTWVRAHAKTTVAVAAAVLFPLRLLAVGRWNLDTALALLQQSDPQSLVVGTLLTLVGGAMLLVMPVFAVLIVAAPTRRAMLRVVLVGALWLGAMGFAPIGPEAFWVGAVYPGGGLFLWASTASRNKWDRFFRAFFLRLYGLFAMISVPLVLGAFLIDDRPWLPRETVRAADGRIVIGYVIADDHDLVVLREADRQVLHLSGPAAARAVCTTGYDDRSMASIALHGTPYQICAESLV